MAWAYFAEWTQTALLLVLLPLPTDPAPKFTVESKLPPAFVVIDKTKPIPADPTGPAPPGYHWERWPGEPWKLVPTPVAAPGVAAPGFPVFNPSHACPSCGRSEYTVYGFNRDGTHNHRCRYDGTVWRH